MAPAAVNDNVIRFAMSTAPNVVRLSSLDVMEGFHLGHAVSALQEVGVLPSLHQPSTAIALARKFKLDAYLLLGVLEYVAARTNLVRKSGTKFVLTKEFTDSSRFLIDLYAGAYRSNATDLKSLLFAPTKASRAVDRVRQARTFADCSKSGLEWLSQLIMQLGFNYVLDIGCGPGKMLVELALQDPHFVGYGMDISESMCTEARIAIRAARAQKRLTVICGDTISIRRVLPASVRTKIQTVTACQVANEMFGKNPSRALNWLQELRKTLPGRTLLISDYYGRLGSKGNIVHRETLLHDYAQVISGQGVPPAGLNKWAALYKRAGCRLVHVFEDKATTRFIHLIAL